MDARNTPSKAIEESLLTEDVLEALIAGKYVTKDGKAKYSWYTHRTFNCEVGEMVLYSHQLPNHLALCHIEDISSICRCKHLEELSLMGCDTITDISMLVCIPNLRSLTLSTFDSLSVISIFADLRYLYYLDLY
jgi:hypothetical protein